MDRASGAANGVRGFAHVIKEDTVSPNVFSWARNSAYGFLWMAASDGRSTKAMIFPAVPGG